MIPSGNSLINFFTQRLEVSDQVNDSTIFTLNPRLCIADLIELSRVYFPSASVVKEIQGLSELLN